MNKSFCDYCNSRKLYQYIYLGSLKKAFKRCIVTHFINEKVFSEFAKIRTDAILIFLQLLRVRSENHFSNGKRLPCNEFFKF